eukprot:s25_g25.t1
MVLKTAASLDAVSLTQLYSFEAAGHWAGTLPVLWSIRHQLRPQMELASRATDPAARRAYAASTGSLEACQSYGYGGNGRFSEEGCRFLVPEFDLLHFKNCVGCAKAAKGQGKQFCA